MFRSQSRSVGGRFSRLLLEEGEYYFGDYAAERQRLGAEPAQAGRLRLLSHSVIFEPDEEASPLLKLKFAAVREFIEHKEHSEWSAEPEDAGDVPEPVPEEVPPAEQEGGGAAQPEPSLIDEEEFDEDAPELAAPTVDEQDGEEAAALDEEGAKPKGKDRRRRSSVEGGIGGMGKGLGKGLGKGMGSVGKGMGSMGKGLKGGVGKGLGAGFGAVASGIDGVKSVGDMAKDGLKDGIDGVKSVGDMAKDGLKDGVGAASGGINTMAEAALSAKSTAAQKTDLGLSTATSGLDSMIGKDSAIGGGVGKGFGAGLKAAKAARDAALNAADVAASAAGAAADKTGVAAVAEKTGISGSLAAGTAAAVSAKHVAAQRTGLDGGLTGAASGLTNRFTRSGLTELASAASGLATGGLTSMTDVVGGVASLASDAMDATVGRLSGAVDGRPTVAITFVCDNAVLMKPHGKDQPYDIDRTLTRYTFTLIASSATPAAEHDAENESDGDAQMATLGPKVRELYDIINLPASEGGAKGSSSWMRPEALEEIIATREEEMEFDTSCIIDPEEETTLFESKAERVSPLVSIPGRILLSNRYLYFQPFSNAEGADEAVLSWALQAEGTGAGDGGLDKLQRRRHALRKTAAELIFKLPRGSKVTKRTAAEVHGAAESVFLAFGTNKEREDFIRLVCENTLLTDDLVDYEQKMRLAAEDWGKGKLSNYEYLMHLNSAAGRSINDIAQYPVMPWVVQDYESDELDLENPSTFRDLSKPIGALESNRLKSVKQRYEEMVSLNDPEMVPFMWGSHYSTAGYVLYYLAREAPDLMLKLQSGDFDKPDRLFCSISRAWRGVLENPMDVKELIPEFYLPSSCAFLNNHREINWGVKQDGTEVGDVELPPWADNSEDFVQQMADALESDYVSDHLHEWIDLIFGHKQQGEAAVTAGNLFRHLSYEGAIDIRTVMDPHERAATLTQINEFGQTPSQLFLAAHPKRSDAASEAGLTLAPLDVVEPDISQLDNPSVADVGKRSSGSSSESRHRRVDTARQSRPKKFLPVVTDRESSAMTSSLGSGWLACGLEGLRCSRQFSSALAGTDAAGGDLPLLAVCATESSSGGASSTEAATRRLYGTAVDGTLRTFDLKLNSTTGEGGAVGVAAQSRSTKLGNLALSAVCLTENDSVALVGSWDNSIYVYSMLYGRIMEQKEAHDAAVSALDLHGDTLISSSWDGTIKVWKLRRGSGGGGSVRLELSMELDGDGHGGGHNAEVTCVAIATKRAAASGKAYDGSQWACSGGSDGTFCVWCIDPARTGTGALVKCYPDSRHPDIAHQGMVTAVAWTEDGCYAASAGEDEIVRLYCVRGSGVSALADVAHALDVSPFTRMHSLRWIGDHLVAGGEEGGLEVWRLERHDKPSKVGLSALADEVDDSASLWASASEYHSGTTVRQLLPLLPGARQDVGPALATVGDDGSIAVWTDKGR